MVEKEDSYKISLLGFSRSGAADRSMQLGRRERYDDVTIDCTRVGNFHDAVRLHDFG